MMVIDQVYRDVINVARKEVWELKHSIRHLHWLLAWILLPLFYTYWDTSRSLVPISVLFLYLPATLSLMTSGQLVLDTILGEKKAKTLEVLLSTKTSPLAIIVGKVLPPTVFGYLISQLGLLGLKAFSLLDAIPVNLAANWFLYVSPFFAGYLTSCLVVMMTILVPDEKAAPMLAILSALVPLAILGFLGSSLQNTLLSVAMLTASGFLFCGLITWLASRTLGRIGLITRI